MASLACPIRRRLPGIHRSAQRPLLLQLLSKYDPQKEAELRTWIEGLTGLSIGPDFQRGLKDGVILCT